jgi:hypothetical protein
LEHLATLLWRPVARRGRPRRHARGRTPTETEPCLKKTEKTISSKKVLKKKTGRTQNGEKHPLS